MGDALTRAWRGGILEAEGFELAAVSDHLEQDGTVVWVDLCDPTAADLQQLAEELQLHELAVEDALGPHQRPKLDWYATHQFLSCRSARLDREVGALLETEVDAFIHPRWLITVRKDAGFAIEPVVRRWDRSPDLAAHGVPFLLYGLLDVVVDGWFDAVEAFDDYYEDVSAAIFSGEPVPPSRQRHWFSMRQALVRFHRIVVPMREAVNGLMRHEQAVGRDLQPYYQDVYDHILRVTEATDSLRELVATIVETNLSLQDYRQNQIMKKVTGWAAIVAVPTLITGWYGMNVPYPGFGEPAGFLTATGLTAGLSGTLYLVFRRRDWL